MTPRPKTSALNVRIAAAEMEYLQGLADDLEITLSEALRASIARSILRDIEHGERAADADWEWVARNARTVTASPLEDSEAVHAPSLPKIDRAAADASHDQDATS